MSWHQYFFLWPCMGWAPPSLFQGGPSMATRIPRWSTKEDGGSSGETSCLLLTCTLNLLDQFCSGEKGRGLGVAPISNPNTFSWSSASPKAERNQCVYVSILILSLSLAYSRFLVLHPSWAASKHLLLPQTVQLSTSHQPTYAYKAEKKTKTQSDYFIRWQQRKALRLMWSASLFGRSFLGHLLRGRDDGKINNLDPVTSLRWFRFLHESTVKSQQNFKTFIQTVTSVNVHTVQTFTHSEHRTLLNSVGVHGRRG